MDDDSSATIVQRRREVSAKSINRVILVRGTSSPGPPYAVARGDPFAPLRSGGSFRCAHSRGAGRLVSLRSLAGGRAARFAALTRGGPGGSFRCAHSRGAGRLVSLRSLAGGRAARFAALTRGGPGGSFRCAHSRGAGRLVSLRSLAGGRAARFAALTRGGPGGCCFAALTRGGPTVSSVLRNTLRRPLAGPVAPLRFGGSFRCAHLRSSSHIASAV